MHTIYRLQAHNSTRMNSIKQPNLVADTVLNLRLSESNPNSWLPDTLHRPSTSRGCEESDLRPLLELVKMLEDYLNEIKDTSMMIYQEKEPLLSASDSLMQIKRASLTPPSAPLPVTGRGSVSEYRRQSRLLPEVYEMVEKLKEYTTQVEQQTDEEDLGDSVKEFFQLVHKSLDLCDIIVRQAKDLSEMHDEECSDVLESVYMFKKQVTFELMMMQHFLQRHADGGPTIPTRVTLEAVMLERSPGQINLDNLAATRITCISEDVVTDRSDDEYLEQLKNQDKR